MTNFRLPGAMCRVLAAVEIDAGTLCRSATPPRGPVKLPPGVKAARAAPGAPAAAASAASSADASASTVRVYAEHRGAVDKPLDYVGQPVYLNERDTAQCATLVKKLAKAPRTGGDAWQRGTMLTASSVLTLESGTPIATGWNARGFYPNNNTGQHSGIFAGAVKDKGGNVIGFTIVEQYSGLSEINERVVYFDPVAMKKRDTYFYRGGDYATIKW